jgi:hypothetical protein
MILLDVSTRYREGIYLSLSVRSCYCLDPSHPRVSCLQYVFETVLGASSRVALAVFETSFRVYEHESILLVFLVPSLPVPSPVGLLPWLFGYHSLSTSWDSELVVIMLWIPCCDVSYHIVSFLIPNPQHTVSLYTFIYQESAWSGRSGLSLREYPETIN